MKNSINVKNTICIIIIAILLILTTNVYAANDSFKTTLSVDNSQAKRGESIKVTIALKDIAIESGEKGIGAYTAKLDFDSSVLEYVSTNGTDKWEAPIYQETRIAGNTIDGEVIKTAQNIATITFKVKENAKLGETTIKLTNFSGSTAGSDVVANDSSVKITVINKDGGKGSISENSNTQNKKTSNSVNKTTVGDVNKENIKQGVFPNTGYTNIIIFVLIGICGLLAISLLVKIKLLNKKNKRSL